MKKLFLLAIVAFGFTAVSFGQSAVAKANAKVLPALSITKGATDLDFGSLIVGTGGTVKIDNAGARTVGTGTVTLVGTTASAAAFTVASAAGSVVNINIPTADIIVKIGGGGPGKEMTVGTWVKSASANPYTMTAATLNLLVGATLTVGATNEAGTYVSDDFNVTVGYN